MLLSSLWMPHFRQAPALGRNHAQAIAVTGATVTATLSL
jgi:hypothetical protein